MKTFDFDFDCATLLVTHFMVTFRSLFLTLRVGFLFLMLAHRLAQPPD